MEKEVHYGTEGYSIEALHRPIYSENVPYSSGKGSIYKGGGGGEIMRAENAFPNYEKEVDPGRER